MPGLKARPGSQMLLHYNLLLACLPNGLVWLKVVTGDMLTRAMDYIKSPFLRKTNKQTKRKIKNIPSTWELQPQLQVKNLTYGSARGTQRTKVSAAKPDCLS